MSRIASSLVLAALALTVSACNSGTQNNTASANTADDAARISSLETQWDQDFNTPTKDPAKLASYYAADAVIMNPGMAPLSGHDAILNSLRNFVADPNLSLQFKSNHIQVAKSGDLAYSVGSYTLARTDPQTHKVMHEQGSYVTDYQKQPDGSWKAVADIATPVSRPMTATAPAPAHHTKKHRR